MWCHHVFMFHVRHLWLGYHFYSLKIIFIPSIKLEALVWLVNYWQKEKHAIHSQWKIRMQTVLGWYKTMPVSVKYSSLLAVVANVMWSLEGSFPVVDEMGLQGFWGSSGPHQNLKREQIGGGIGCTESHFRTSFWELENGCQWVYSSPIQYCAKSAR